METDTPQKSANGTAPITPIKRASTLGSLLGYGSETRTEQPTTPEYQTALARCAAMLDASELPDTAAITTVAGSGLFISIARDDFLKLVALKQQGT